MAEKEGRKKIDYIPNVIKQKVLEVFVTSAVDPIYACNFNIPPEVFGAFGSYFSRNPKDFREHLWDAITGQIAEHESEVGIEDFKWLSDKDFRNPYEALKKGIGKSQDFFKKWYGKYSHKSIANTVWIPMVATNASQLFARELAYDPLAFFIEQSTRYVFWKPHKMYHDPELTKIEEFANLSNLTFELLAMCYHEFEKKAEEHYFRRYPFDDWIKNAPEKTQKSSKESQQREYNRVIWGKSLDLARFILPQAAQTNIAWILDARSTEFDIASWKGHPLPEIIDAAYYIEKHAGQIAPSLLKYTERSDYYSDKLHNYYGDLETKSSEKFGKGIDVISYDPNALDSAIAHLLKRHNFGGTYRERLSDVQKMSFNRKIEILERVTRRRGSHDEWIERSGEAFDLPKVTFGIRTDIGAIRDWRRHQKWDRSEALYSMDNGVHRPKILEEMGVVMSSIFDRAMNEAYEAEQKVKKDFPFQAQYFVPMATMHEITMSGGLDQLQYMLWTRSTPEGNWSYRDDAFNIAETWLKIYPWLWGYEEFPEGKTLNQVYEEAPLKNVLKLQFGETGFHH